MNPNDLRPTHWFLGWVLEKMLHVDGIYGQTSDVHVYNMFFFIWVSQRKDW